MKKVIVYTDGACSGNPGPGGWASILIYNGHEKIISGAVGETTNNRMELFAVIEALRHLKEPCHVEVYSDSSYFVNAINEGWINAWRNNNFKTADKKDVKNIDLWRDYILKSQRHLIKAIKVKGHSDNELNNRCDALAKAEIKRLTGDISEKNGLVGGCEA